MLQCPDPREEAETIADRVQKLLAEGVEPRDVALIYGSVTHQKALWQQATARGIPYFWVGRNQKSKSEVIKCGNVVRAANLGGFKGVEFRHVFVCGVNQIDERHVDDESTKRRLVYVALTRAIDRLTVTVSGAGEVGSAVIAAQA